MLFEDTEQTQSEENSKSARIKTVEAYISGRVQGVGFRACVKRIALGLCITGEVMNLEDGSVHIIATGESAIIDKLLSSLYECPHAYVHEIKTSEINLRNFNDFTILRPI